MWTLISATITGCFEVILEQVLCCRLSMTLLRMLWEVTVFSKFNLQYSIHAEYLMSLAAQSGKAASILVLISFQRISCFCQKSPGK